MKTKQFCTLKCRTSNEIEPAVRTSFYSEKCDEKKINSILLIRYSSSRARAHTRTSTADQSTNNLYCIIDTSQTLFSYGSFDSLSLIYRACVCVCVHMCVYIVAIICIFTQLCQLFLWTLFCCFFFIQSKPTESNQFC